MHASDHWKVMMLNLAMKGVVGVAPRLPALRGACPGRPSICSLFRTLIRWHKNVSMVSILSVCARCQDELVSNTAEQVRRRRISQPVRRTSWSPKHFRLNSGADRPSLKRHTIDGQDWQDTEG